MIVQRTLLSLTLFAFLSQVCLAQKVEVVWHQERFKNKHDPDGSGGEKIHRDVFCKHGYQLYDFFIHVHSVRGGGSEFAEFTLEQGGNFVIGTPVGTGIAEWVRRNPDAASKRPHARINGECVVIYSKVAWGRKVFAESGGNVEFTVHGLFVKGLDISGRNLRFNYAGFASYGTEANRERIEKNVDLPIASIGPIHVTNNYGPGGTVDVRLYHADNLRGPAVGNWSFRGSTNANLHLNNKPLILGGDWEIEIVFGNGAQARRYLSSAGHYRDGTWKVSATEIFGGRSIVLK